MSVHPDDRKMLRNTRGPAGVSTRSMASPVAAHGLKHVFGTDPRANQDYFAFAPGDPAGDQGTEPSRGTAKVRYRAYKVLDLTPEAGSPDPTASPERFLTSEASAWTSWVRPEGRGPGQRPQTAIELSLGPTKPRTAPSLWT